MHPVWKVSECKVVQILGGEGHPSIEKHASYLVSQLARLVQGDAHFLPAPGLVASKEVADVLGQDPNVRETMKLFDLITAGSGNIKPSWERCEGIGLISWLPISLQRKALSWINIGLCVRQDRS